MIPQPQIQLHLQGQVRLEVVRVELAVEQAVEEDTEIREVRAAKGSAVAVAAERTIT
jgi:hypothetical protein